ncbi:hypothetical protein NLI96_g837 [Meripilus lineatus]|uniref:LysM domain-containing protein n=1 Tax=Meripilus lineatus TaxID=2056292 RepID=A0AAD5VBZ4_9APHY|nr:hypothetical protein NLI96_g837 [Physisporinus lineatus]
MPVSAISNDDIPSLYHNPFAGHSESSFTSAINPKRSHTETRPRNRRRGSESSVKRARNDHDSWSSTTEATSSSHSRSRTEDSLRVATASTTSLHPLVLGNQGSPSILSLPSPGDSRPYLKRALSNVSTSQGDSDDAQEDVAATWDEPEREKVVIVHQVCTGLLPVFPFPLSNQGVQVSSQDSLAGVALKYGISLANLRRANQLWATDSIHFRQELYIPLEFIHKSKQAKFSLDEFNLNGSSSQEGSPESQSTQIPHGGMDTGVGVGGNVTLRRVPASQLSFFPRPTTSASVSTPDVFSTSQTLPRSLQSTSRRPDLPTGFSSGHLSTAPPGFMLPSLPIPSASNTSILPTRSQISSLFSTLPFAPSTRDTIIARLSLDSGASTPTQSSDDQDLELEDVGHSSRRRMRSSETGQHADLDGRPRSDLAGFLSSRGNTGSLDTPLELRSFIPSVVSPSRSPTQIRHTVQHNSPPTGSRNRTIPEYISPEVIDDLREPIRTSQLQPSPSMQLPLRTRRDKPVGS